MRRAHSRNTSPPREDSSPKSQYSSPTRQTKQPHPLLSLYREPGSPQPMGDQFTPYLSRKLAMRSSDKVRRQRNDLFELTDPQFGERRKSIQQETLAPTVPEYIEMEQVFDSIAVAAMTKGLNQAVETNFKSFFKCESVTFFFDVPSVQLLYSPSTALVYPHGSGLVGYCHFSRDILNIDKANAHVQFDKTYDAKTYHNESRLLIFPVFDLENRVVAVIQMSRTRRDIPFSEMDVKNVEYFRSKLKTYSGYLFNFSLNDVDIASLTGVQRLEPFIESIQEKLEKLFYCRSAELWDYDQEKHEVRQFASDTKKEVKLKAQNGGIVGHCLANHSILSLVSAGTHSAYNPKVDGSSDHSLIVMPVKDPHSMKLYAIALRGKKIPYFFTEKDEKLLELIAPIVVTALSSSEVVEKCFLDLEESKKAQKRQQCLLDVAETLSGRLHFDELIPCIMNKACELVNADRCSLFIVSENREKLITSFHGGLSSAIEVPINVGIVGWSATTGKVANIQNAYDDPRFNRATDIATGYQTRTLLCVPIFDDKGVVRGVTEMVNKMTMGGFTSDDEKLIQVFNTFTGISVENARLYQASISLSLQLRSVIEISQSISQSSESKSLLKEIIRNARKVIGAGRSMIYVHDAKNKKCEVYALDEDIEAKAIQAAEKGPKGPTFTKKAFIRKIMFDEDPKDDKEKEKEKEDQDRQSYISRAILARESNFTNNPDNSYYSMAVVPIVGSDRTTTGAFVMQWKKRKNSSFTSDDVRLMEAFAVFISIAMERSKMKEAVQYGPLELALRQNLTESERLSILVPATLVMAKEEVATLLTPGFSSYTIDDTGLFKIGFWLFDVFGLRHAYKMNNETLFSFLFKLKEAHKPQSYLNWHHAIQMAQMLAYVIINGKMLDFFTPFDRFALLVSTLACNVGADETKTTNNIPLSVLYNGQSVQESYHASILINIVSDPQANIFLGFKGDEQVKIWEAVIGLIQATDMGRHFEIMDQIGKKSDTEHWHKDPNNKMHVMKLLMKTLDISDVFRPFDFATKFKDSLAEKFFEYGDITRCYGMVYTSDQKTKENIDRRASLIGFMNYIAVPVLIHAARVFPVLAITVEQARQNTRLWETS